MRWFKHMTNSIDDEKISKLVDECGLEGYGFFWRVLEMIAAQVDDDGKNYCSYSKRTWCNKLAIKHQTWSKLIASCEQAGLFEVSDDGQTITVKSPNILKYRDEWSRKKAKNSGVSPEKLRSNSGVSRARFSSSKEKTRIGGLLKGVMPINGNYSIFPCISSNYLENIECFLLYIP